MGSQNIRLDWRPDIYGTWLYWILAWDVAAGAPAETDEPLGSSTWHYVLYGSDDFDQGASTLTVPAPGEYWFFLARTAWDAATLGEFGVAVGTSGD